MTCVVRRVVKAEKECKVGEMLDVEEGFIKMLFLETSLGTKVNLVSKDAPGRKEQYQCLQGRRGQVNWSSGEGAIIGFEQRNAKI